MNRSRIVRSLPLVIALAAPLVVAAMPEVAYAQDPNQAEKMRLEEEMKKLAQKNAWAGVEDYYNKLLDLKVDLSFDDHLLGAQAAGFLGKTYEKYERLQSAKKIKTTDEIDGEIAGIESNYGKVEIKGNPRHPPAFAPKEMPFAPDQRKSVEYATGYVTNTGSFKGMLPAGEYTVGEQTFTVTAGSDWQTVTVGKVKSAPATASTGGGTAPAQPEGVGLIVYSGPVAVAGYNFSTSGAPTAPPNGDAGSLQPASLGGSGLAVEVGAEIGFTRQFGVAAVLGYHSLYGSDHLDGVQGWLAAAIRPGDLRIAVGPTYSMIHGHGTGVADWWDIGQDPTQYPSKDITYKGTSLAGGFQIGAGYGVMDFGDKLQGLVELDGNWATDGTRSYAGGGVRVGIVPKIKRYKG